MDVSRVKHTFLAFLLLLGFTAVIGCSSPTGNAEDGKRWFAMHRCDGCHGPHGNDGRSPNITGLDMSYGAFLKRLRNAKSVTMPVFPESKISNQDAADILAYINTL